MRSLSLLLLVWCAIGADGEDSTGQISFQRKSTSGIEGWTQADYRHSKGAWMNRTLVLKTKAGGIQKFEAGYAFIMDWGFCDADSHVVVQSQNAHGPYQWELFDIGSGELLETYYRSKAGEPPEWAKPFLK